MILHSTNGISPKASLAEGIANGIAPDGGLYMPDSLPRLPKALFRNIADMSLKEIAYVICNTLFGGHLTSAAIKKIVDESLTFPIPLKHLAGNRYVLELFHGPTLSFKDVGARIMSQLIPAINGCGWHRDILLATSGDSGGAVANAFRKSPATTVNILFPKGELTKSQIAEFATLRNVRAIEVDGTFDDCQQLIRETLHSDVTTGRNRFTSGNSINLARELPSIIYFFHAYSRAVAIHGPEAKIVIAIPCGNLGSFCAALMAKKMGLPVL
ncbi:MAG: threonine synthase, partial [Muribaculaceae bacterium]|nr:threonine synthase [Muribaculaceae bacterium]